MLSRKLPNSVLYTKPNLKNIFMNSATSKCYFFRCSFTVRDLEVSNKLRYTRNIKDKMKFYLINGTFLRILQDTFSSIPRTLKEQSTGVLRVWAHQCECVFAQRLRRCQQMFCLYTRLWEERALKDLLNRMRHQIAKHGKEFMLGAVGIASYNWDTNRISSEEIERHMNELDYIHLLTEKTLGCENCSAQQLISGNCSCPNRNAHKKQFDEWTPFVEKKDMIVWRKLHENSGNYEYKVYGSFDDISGEDFLNVQIDVEYRKNWDTTAIALEVIEKDPTPMSNSDIVYWELLWPKLFANRDYVFNRRFVIDFSNKTIVIASRGTIHPSCPVRPDKYRVETYWSFMVIKPYTELEKPGLEFALTYFDDPGLNVPSTITTWVALRAMPDYLTRLRFATKEYKLYCSRSDNHLCQSVYKQQKDLVEDRKLNDTLKHLGEEDEKLDNVPEALDDSVTGPNSLVNKIRNLTSRSSETKEPSQVKVTTTENIKTIACSPGSEIMTAPTPITQAETNKPRYWKYLRPAYYLS